MVKVETIYLCLVVKSEREKESEKEKRELKRQTAWRSWLGGERERERESKFISG